MLINNTNPISVSVKSTKKRFQSALRISVASALFMVTGLVSAGTTATPANAKGKTKKLVQKVKAFKKKAAAAGGEFRLLNIYKSFEKSKPAQAAKYNSSNSGEASWYGGFFHGRLTASGKKFDKNGLSAAHRTLPFGTKIRVTNLDNQKSVIVEVNDRGPYVADRILDLSEGAAKALDYADNGTADVRMEVIGREESDYQANIASNDQVQTQPGQLEPSSGFSLNLLSLIRPVFDAIPQLGSTMDDEMASLFGGPATA